MSQIYQSELDKISIEPIIALLSVSQKSDSSTDE